MWNKIRRPSYPRQARRKEHSGADGHRRHHIRQKPRSSRRVLLRRQQREFLGLNPSPVSHGRLKGLGRKDRPPHDVRRTPLRRRTPFKVIGGVLPGADREVRSSLALQRQAKEPERVQSRQRRLVDALPYALLCRGPLLHPLW